MRKPEIKIKTNGVHAEIYVNGNKLEGVKGYRFLHNTCQNEGLPILQIDMIATDVTLETEMLPALPYPYNQFYFPISVLLESGKVTKEDINNICRERGLDLEFI